ncbi:substrate-binding domain-containing protein [Kiritimatiellota bacterium B12222]|nr:substrate-binding domain-containing protein [Kiritimatiellota bacterium B12222]
MPKSVSAQVISVPFVIRDRPFLNTVLKGIRAYVRQHTAWEIILPQYYVGLHGFEDFQPKVIGQITGVPKARMLPEILKRQVPTVLVGYSPRPDFTSTVILDYEKMAKEAVTHFVQQGITRLALVGSRNERKHDHREFGRHILMQAQIYGVPCEAYLGGGQDEELTVPLYQQFEHLAEWLRGQPYGVGIICADDAYANRIMMAANRVGRRAGHDFLLMGCGNDSAFCESVTPALTSMDLGYEEMGWLAAKKLHALIAHSGEENEEVVISSSEVRMRRSSRRIGRPGSFVAQAMDLIWHASDNIPTPEQVAKSLGINRRTLDRHFMAQLDRSISTEIRSARIAIAENLLLENEISLAEVAFHCGFSDQAHLCREVKRETGLTPTAIRNHKAR